MKLYRTFVRPVVTYDSETWTLTATDVSVLKIFLWKIIIRFMIERTGG